MDTKSAIVYLINARGTSRYKIGFTVNMNARLSALQTGNHVDIYVVACMFVDNAADTELKLHTKWKEFRVGGEWFDIPINYAVALLKDFSPHLDLVPTPSVSTNVTVSSTITEAPVTTATTSPMRLKAQTFINENLELSKKATETGSSRGAIAYAYCALLEDCLEGEISLTGFGSKSRFVSRLHKGGVIICRGKDEWAGYLQELIDKGYIRGDGEKVWID